MSEQLAFQLPYHTFYGREKFWVAPCNQEAIAWIDRFPDWPEKALLIYGPTGCGKTHLASLFSDVIVKAQDLTTQYRPEFYPKIVVEDLQNLANEEALLHLFNFMREMGGHLLLTTQSVSSFILPDLQSRMNMIPKAEIMMPDESVIRAIAQKTFAERHVLVDESVLDYLSTHLTRSFAFLQKVLNATDQFSLETGHKITIPIIKSVLQDLKEAQDVTL